MALAALVLKDKLPNGKREIDPRFTVMSEAVMAKIGIPDSHPKRADFVSRFARILSRSPDLVGLLADLSKTP